MTKTFLVDQTVRTTATDVVTGRVEALPHVNGPISAQDSSDLTILLQEKFPGDTIELLDGPAWNIRWKQNEATRLEAEAAVAAQAATDAVGTPDEGRLADLAKRASDVAILARVAADKAAAGN